MIDKVVQILIKISQYLTNARAIKDASVAVVVMENSDHIHLTFNGWFQQEILNLQQQQQRDTDGREGLLFQSGHSPSDADNILTELIFNPMDFYQ